METAADYFHMLLLHAPEARAARAYVEGRSLHPNTQASFRLGYALDSWDACRFHFNDKGYSDEELLAVGLLTENPETERRYDRFRNRLMIPIRDINGRVVGFGARTLAKDGVPKYLNSPQTTLFDKGRLLFGLDMGKRHIREARQVVIVEGYMDVMQAWQAGFRNVVAQMGTALTGDQLQMLKRYTKRFVLALDADAAGAKATMRSLQVARETLDREVETRFDARGLIQHEGRLKADIRIVTLPEGEDPDAIIRADVSRWPLLLAQAKPIVAYVIAMAMQGVDLDDVKAKTSVAQQVVPLIKEIPDPVERDHYWQELAYSLHIDERALRQITIPSKPTYQPNKEQVTAPTQTNMMLGSHGPIPNQRRVAKYLSQCLHYPQVMHQVNHRLMQQRQKTVTEADFDTAEDKILLRYMYQRLEGATVASIEELCDSLDEPIQSRVQVLLTSPPIPESELNRLPDKLVLYVLDWRLEKIRDGAKELQNLFRQTQGQQSKQLAQLYGQQIREAHVAIRNINQARNAMSSHRP